MEFQNALVHRGVYGRFDARCWGRVAAKQTQIITPPPPYWQLVRGGYADVLSNDQMTLLQKGLGLLRCSFANLSCVLLFFVFFLQKTGFLLDPSQWVILVSVLFQSELSLTLTFRMLLKFDCRVVVVGLGCFCIFSVSSNLGGNFVWTPLLED